ncbi:MAG: translation elongation factor Ts [Eubacteriales bacterium]|nr:translation elongation factor Ts [Eubacteriales bacterium]
MAAFTAKDVAALRERTGAGMMDCKKALTQCEGDVEKAIDFLREKGLAAAAKKAGRIAAEGIVADYRGENASAIVEVNCETDFVAKTDKFKDFVKTVAKQVVEANPATVEELMASKIGDETVEAMLNTAVAGIGEKISIRRFVRLEGAVDTYIHLGGRIGVIAQFDKEADKEAMHDVALQIAAANPICVDVNNLPADVMAHERAIQLAKAKEENAASAKPKPDAIVEKMVDGRMSKYYKEVCLDEQQFVKDQNLTIKQMLAAKGGLKVLQFVRYEMGEGLQKREDNFADEVMSQMKK